MTVALLVKDGGMDIEALVDLRTPWCVYVVATLRIAQHIESGRTEIADLAAAAHCDPVSLRRVLRHLVSKGVFEEPTPGRFALNDPARQLLDEGLRLYLDLDGLGSRFAGAWSTLLSVVRTGRPAYEERFGLPYWEDLDAHPELRSAFDELMGPTGHGTPDPELLLDGDWSGVRTVVDVGGGAGSLLAAILRARPTLRGTLVDLPHSVAGSIEVFRDAGVSDRVTTVGQSFFDPLPHGADLYVVASILNDWPDEQTIAILRRVADAARPSNGQIVVRGGVSPDEVSGDDITVEMVLLAGRNNSLDEFRELARQAGLDIVAAGRIPSGAYVVECRAS